MSPHALAQPWKVVPYVHLTQFGHQGALTAFEKGDLDVLLSKFGCEYVLRLFRQVGLGVVGVCLDALGGVDLFEQVRLNATSTMFQSQTSQPSTLALLAPSLSYVLLFLTLSKSTNPYAPKVNFVNLNVRFANYRSFP